MTVPRVAVLGAGNWGRNHVRTLSGMPGVTLAAVCDPEPSRREETQRLHPGVTVTDDVDAALSQADAVVIAAPATVHVALAKRVIDRGLPVLIEKPMALTVADAEALVDHAERTGVPVVVGHVLLFHPAIERLRDLIAGGELGEVYYLYGRRVNLGRVRPDENALWSFGPHDVSITMHILGERPVRVAAHGRAFLQPGIEDIVFFTMEFESGILAQIQMSWLDPHKERELTVVGSRRMVVFDDMRTREKLTIFDRGIDRPPEYGSYGESLAIREGDILIPRVPNAEPLRAELSHFVDVIQGRAAPRVTARDGLDVVRVLAAASDSLKRGGPFVSLT